MTEHENVQRIQEIYAAFGRGDVPAILDQLRDDVAWYDPGPPEVPHAARYRGREEVGGFSTRIAETQEFEEFTPTEFSRPRGSRHRPWLPTRARQGNGPLVRQRVGDGLDTA
jgi:hypothetical protein